MTNSPETDETTRWTTRPAHDATPSRDVRSIERPHSSLLTYYVLLSLLWGPLLVFVLPYLFFRYRTMRYRIDDEGVTMQWGALFRREISLTYSRIQDIHLVSNVVERHLGLARLKVQTAAGSSTAEMTIEGLREFEAVRDFLYERMRGRRRDASSESVESLSDGRPADGRLADGSVDPVVEALQEATRELRLLREEMSRARSAQETTP